MQTIPHEIRADVETLRNYHRVDDQLEPVDVAVGLGSHDPSVAIYTAELYAKRLFPLIVFTGANAPTTVERFPRGEAVHYREIALDHGVPNSAILVEPNAKHTGQNIDYTRQLLDDRGCQPRSVLLISRPYQQRRALATALKRWPGVEIRCSAVAQTLDEYIASIGDARRVIDMLVGDTQRIAYYAECGETAPQDVPRDVQEAYERLVAAGFTSRLIR